MTTLTSGRWRADLAAVRSAAHAYEQALVDGDAAAATAWFSDDGSVSRFGPEGWQLGPAGIAAVRAATPPVAPPRWLHEDVLPLGEDAVLHLAVLRRGATAVQRTQVWTRTAAGWRIAHAHVSGVLPS